MKKMKKICDCVPRAINKRTFLERFPNKTVETTLKQVFDVCLIVRYKNFIH